MAAFGLWVAAAVSVGTIHSGHREAMPGCSDCGAENAVVLQKVEKLRTASLWIVRR